MTADCVVAAGLCLTSPAGLQSGLCVNVFYFSSFDITALFQMLLNSTNMDMNWLGLGLVLGLGSDMTADCVIELQFCPIRSWLTSPAGL